MIEGTSHFRRFKKEAESWSPHLKFRRIKKGFYRIYWHGSGKPAYIYECMKNMSFRGYQWEHKNLKLENKKYYEKKEDNIDTIYRVKNFREGYTESIRRLRTILYQFRHNKEHYKIATEGYERMRVK